MIYEFKIGDGVMLKEKVQVFPYSQYRKWGVIPGKVYIVSELHQGILIPYVRLKGGMVIPIEDLKDGYPEMLEKVLE